LVGKDLRLPDQTCAALREASMAFSHELIRHGYGQSSFELTTD
jgi:hypothetical protein